MACQAQQSPTPSDAKISDMTNILATLLNPSDAQSATQRGSTLGSIDPQSPLSLLSSTTSQSEPNLLAKSAEDSHQLPERVLPHQQPHILELPDLGHDVWGVHPVDHDWRSPTGDLSASSPTPYDVKLSDLTDSRDLLKPERTQNIERTQNEL